MSRKKGHPEGGVIRRWKNTNRVTEEDYLRMERMAELFTEIKRERYARLEGLEEREIMKTMVFPEDSSILNRLSQMGQAISRFLTNRREAA